MQCNHSSKTFWLLLFELFPQNVQEMISCLFNQGAKQLEMFEQLKTALSTIVRSIHSSEFTVYSSDIFFEEWMDNAAF